jgi:hypothetical protein
MDVIRRRAALEQITELRHVVNRCPEWRPATNSLGEPVVVDVGGRTLLRVVGPWSPDMVRWFTTFDQYGLLELVQLLERLVEADDGPHAAAARSVVARLLSPPPATAGRAHAASAGLIR